MTIKLCLVTVAVLLTGHAQGSETVPPPPAARIFLVPTAAPGAEPSKAMQEMLVWLQEQDAFHHLDTWSRLAELPKWTRNKKEGVEIFVINQSPTASDTFEYTVIIAENQRPLVVRTGGIAGVYEIYRMKGSRR